MFKKLLLLSLLSLMIATFVACGDAEPDPEPAPEPVVEVTPEPSPEPAPTDVEEDEVADDGWRIGIVTGTASQGEGEYLAAMEMQERFGADLIVRITYPDNFGAEMEVTVANVLSLVEQGAQAIVFVQAVPGTIAAIQATRERFGDDIFFFVGTPHEPPTEISRHADIAMVSDDLSLGRAIVEQAHTMGADTFAHISFPRHLGMDNVTRRRDLLYQTATELGMQWQELESPDPMIDGVTATRTFIYENVPTWIDDFGENTAFFATHCDMQETLITQIAAYGGFFPLQCHPNPFHAFPDAFDISLTGHEGDVNFVLEQTRTAIAAAGGTGRFSTWPVSINMLLVEVGVMYSIEYLEGNIDRHDRDALRRIINEAAASYNASIEISNWPLDDGTFIDNFYRVLSNFVNF